MSDKYISIKRALALLLLAAYLALMSAEAFAGAIIRGNGTLTSLERSRSAVIDKKNFLLTGSTRFIDVQGKRVSPEHISLPARVDFKYEYTPTGPVIKILRIYPKIMPR